MNEQRGTPKVEPELEQRFQPPAAPVERGEPDKVREALGHALREVHVVQRRELADALGLPHDGYPDSRALADALLALRQPPREGGAWVSAAEADFLFAALEQVAQTLSHEAEIAKNAIKEHGARTWPRIHTTSAGETQ